MPLKTHRRRSSGVSSVRSTRSKRKLDSPKSRDNRGSSGHNLPRACKRRRVDREAKPQPKATKGGQNSASNSLEFKARTIKRITRQAATRPRRFSNEQQTKTKTKKQAKKSQRKPRQKQQQNAQQQTAGTSVKSDLKPRSKATETPKSTPRPKPQQTAKATTKPTSKSTKSNTRPTKKKKIVPTSQPSNPAYMSRKMALTLGLN